VISAAENSNKFQKTRFWKEKSVEDVVTLKANSTSPTSSIGERRKTFAIGNFLGNMSGTWE
jgi:hypothetical protein